MTIETPQNDALQDSTLDERQLLERAKSDPKAVSLLYRQHYTAIYGYVYRRIGHTHDTHDIVADVFVAMVRYLPGFRWTGVPFRCWLLKLSTSQINRWIRRKRFSRLWQSFDVTRHLVVTPTDRSQELLEPVRIAIFALPIAIQTVLTLHYFEGLSVDVIAQIMNCRPGTVKSRLSRGRDLLRKTLSQLEARISYERQPIGRLSEEFDG